MANSVTVNTILSNYIVNLRYAWELFWNQKDEGYGEYFRIVEGNPTRTDLLLMPDSVRMIMNVVDGECSFSRKTYEQDVS